MMFSGLMSRWTMPAAWATASARASCAPMCATELMLSGRADHRVQRAPVHEFHGQETPVLQLADLVDGDDVRVVER